MKTPIKTKKKKSITTLPGIFINGSEMKLDTSDKNKFWQTHENFYNISRFSYVKETN